VDRNPALALEYVQKGLAFVQEQWPLQGRDFEASRRTLWPSLLRAQVALGSWKPACAVGEALVAEIEDAALELEEGEEAAARKDYAEALERTASPEAALRQRELAADPAKMGAAREAGRRRRVLAGKIERPAADFYFHDLSGKSIRLEDYRGKTVILSM